jgi:hypothetical protein
MPLACISIQFGKLQAWMSGCSTVGPYQVYHFPLLARFLLGWDAPGNFHQSVMESHGRVVNTWAEAQSALFVGFYTLDHVSNSMIWAVPA